MDLNALYASQIDSPWSSVALIVVRVNIPAPFRWHRPLTALGSGGNFLDTQRCPVRLSSGNLKVKLQMPRSAMSVSRD